MSNNLHSETSIRNYRIIRDIEEGELVVTIGIVGQHSLKDYKKILEDINEVCSIKANLDAL